MGKKVLNKSAMTELVEHAQDLLFMPTAPQRKLKASFWAKYRDHAAFSSENITKALVAQLTNSSQLDKWWGLPGFREWFLNADEHKERLEYLYSLCLDAAENILVDPDANQNAKVQMIKVVSELANKVPSRKEEKYLDADIQGMDEKQLKKYLEKRGVKLVKEPPKDG